MYIFYCIGSGLTLAALAVAAFMILRKRTLYQLIPVNVDPLDEGREGWHGLAAKHRAKNLKTLLVVAVLVISLGCSFTFALGIVGPSVQAAISPPPTATATIPPTATVTATPGR